MEGPFGPLVRKSALRGANEALIVRFFLNCNSGKLEIKLVIYRTKNAMLIHFENNKFVKWNFNRLFIFSSSIFHLLAGYDEVLGKSFR